MTDGMLTLLKALPDGALDPWSCYLNISIHGDNFHYYNLNITSKYYKFQEFKFLFNKSCLLGYK